MKFSIIGCQHKHISIFIQEMLDFGHECAGIYEKENIKLAKEVADRYAIPLVSDKSRLLDDSISIVGCAAINNEKIEVIESCEKHHKHIMVDKPAVTNEEGFKRLKAVVNRGNIQIGMLLTERYRASMITLKNYIERGELGEIVHIGMRKPHRLSADTRPPWHFDKRQNGGIILDLFIHDVDLIHWLTGKKVISTGGYMAKTILPQYPTFYDIASLHVQLEDNVFADLYADWHTPEMSWTWGDCRIFVTGTKGKAEIRLEGDPLVSPGELILLVTNQTPLENVHLDAVPRTITEDFLQRIDGAPSSLTAEDILLATEATIRANQSVTVINPDAKVQY